MEGRALRQPRADHHPPRSDQEVVSAAGSRLAARLVLASPDPRARLAEDRKIPKRREISGFWWNFSFGIYLRFAMGRVHVRSAFRRA